MPVEISKMPDEMCKISVEITKIPVELDEISVEISKMPCQLELGKCQMILPNFSRSLVSDKRKLEY